MGGRGVLPPPPPPPRRSKTIGLLPKIWRSIGNKNAEWPVTSLSYHPEMNPAEKETKLW